MDLLTFLKVSIINGTFLCSQSVSAIPFLAAKKLVPLMVNCNFQEPEPATLDKTMAQEPEDSPVFTESDTEITQAQPQEHHPSNEMSVAKSPSTFRKRTRTYSLLETVPKRPHSMISSFITEINNLIDQSASRGIGEDSKELIIENFGLIQGKNIPITVVK